MLLCENGLLRLSVRCVSVNRIRQQQRLGKEERIAEGETPAEKRIKERIIEASICDEDIEMSVVTKRKALYSEVSMSEWTRTEPAISTPGEAGTNLRVRADAYGTSCSPHTMPLSEQNWAGNDDQESDTGDPGGEGEKRRS